METIDNIIKCNLCSKVLENPIILTCGTTICKKHIDEHLIRGEFELHCYQCNTKHRIEKNATYTPNRVAEALIKKRFDKLDFADFGDEYRNAMRSLNNLKATYASYEKKRKDPPLFITEFFNSLEKDIVDKRDELKARLDTLSKNLLDDIRNERKRFEEDGVTSSVTAEHFHNIKAYIERSENNMNSFVINPDLWKAIESRSESFKGLLERQIGVFEDVLLYKKNKEFNEKFLNVNELFYKGLEFNQKEYDKFQFTLKMTPDYINLKETKCFGNNKPYIIKNIPFEIFVNLTPSSQYRDTFLEIYILSVFESKFRHWNLDVDYEFRLLSRFVDRTIIRRSSCSFKHKSVGRGFKELISFRDLMDRSNGYLDDDDFINIEAFIKVKSLKFEQLAE